MELTLRLVIPHIRSSCVWQTTQVAQFEKQSPNLAKYWMQRPASIPVLYYWAVQPSPYFTNDLHTLYKCRKMRASKSVCALVFLSGEKDILKIVINTSCKYRALFINGTATPLSPISVMIFASICSSFSHINGQQTTRGAPVDLA